MCIEKVIVAVYDTIADYIQGTEQDIVRLRAEGDTERAEDMRTRITLLEEIKRRIMTKIENGNQTGVILR